MIRLDHGTIGETAMSKQFTSISLATVATLGAFAMSVESASAIPRPTSSIPISHGFGRPAGSGPGSIKPIHVHRHVHWRHRYRWGVYAPPIYVNYARPCYFVRRPAGLFKVCPVD
jgi:hypothetical protein